MRFGVAVIAAFLLLGDPAESQPGGAAQIDRQLSEAGRWAERLGEALTVAADGFRDLNQGMQALASAGPTRDRAAAAAPDLRRRIERSRGDIRRSNAILDGLLPYPAIMESEIPPAQLVADARAFNARMLALLDSYDRFIAAMAESDMAAMERALPAVTEGVFALVGHQRLLLRNRQASVKVSDSSHQSLGVAGQIYRAMEAVLRASISARTGSGATAQSAAALSDELRLVADETRALAAAGRRNVEREVAEVDAYRASGESERRLMERVRRVFLSEAKVFELADRLVAFAESNKGVTAAQLRAPGPSPLFPPLKQLEADYLAIAMEQAAILAEGAQ